MINTTYGITLFVSILILSRFLRTLVRALPVCVYNYVLFRKGAGALKRTYNLRSSFSQSITVFVLCLSQ